MICFFVLLIGPLLSRHPCSGFLLLKTSNWTPAFAGVTILRTMRLGVVIPAQAGIQDEKREGIHV